ncbi:MAG TPA: hypothetical protein DEG69_01210 [Flavobacteriaceae bacterium]|mgnify:FL=1|nr:hypothetical protein [Flavobacteriaceae bacterium]|tara:strand:- start:67 stop:444 length:378 start_codon:yes stop_codon:yes gene_type:complete
MQISVKENDAGYLVPFYLQGTNTKRVFIIKNKRTGDTRGNHAHKRDSQVLVLLNGQCNLEFENSDGVGNLDLQFGVPYFSRPYEWLKIHMLQENTIILVLSKEEYDEEEYIRDYQEFCSYLQGEK